MATKFLRKIILEELQKVLKEADTSNSDDWFKQNVADDGDSYTSGPSGKTSSLNPISLNPGQAELGKSYKTKSYGSPTEELPGPIKITALTPAQKFKRSIKNLQKELVRLGIARLDINGKPDMYTEEALKIVYPGLNFKKLDSAEKADRLVGFLKVKPVEYGKQAVARYEKRMEDELGSSMSATEKIKTGAQPTFEESGLPKVEYDFCKKLGVVQKCMDEYAATGKVTSIKQQESLTREIRKLLRSI